MTDHTPRTDEAENETDGLPHDEADAKLLALARTLEQENLRLEAELAGARWEAKRAFELLAEANRAIANVTLAIDEAAAGIELSPSWDSPVAKVNGLFSLARGYRRSMISTAERLRQNEEYAGQCRAALKRYGSHDYICDALIPMGDQKCTCGFDAALAKTPNLSGHPTTEASDYLQAEASGPVGLGPVEPLTGEKLALRIRAVLMAHRLQHTLADDESGGHRLVDALTMPFDETIKTGIDEIDILAEEIACHLDDARVENIPEWAKDCGQFPHCSCWPGRCVSQNAAPEGKKQ